MEIRVVDDPAEVTSALAGLDEPIVGVDVERANGESYTRPAALVQVGANDRCVLLDAVALPDLGALGVYLAERFVVLHALENDLAPLRAVGADPVRDGQPHRRVADTAIAAAMLGLPTGLSTLLADLLGVELSADKERHQRADWTLRPLDPELIDYAAADAVHLPALWERLSGRLEEEGRTAWYEQELAAAITQTNDSGRAWTRTRGAGRLDGRGRTFLRALWEEREAIATAEDVAPQRVVRDDVLVDLAEDPPQTIGVLERRGLYRRQAAAYGERLLGALRRAASLPDEPSLHGRRVTDEDRAAEDCMRKARAAVARDLGIDPGVLCPSRVLRDAVLADPQTPDELCEAAGLRPWQRDLLETVLWDAYTDDEAR